MSEKLHALGDALFRAFPQADILRTQVSQWVQAHGDLVWLYTGVTRARELLIVVGDDQALGRMAANDRQQRRYSGLRWRLKNAAAE